VSAHVCDAALTGPSVRVLIAINVRLYREGLARALSGEERIRVVQAVARVDDALAGVASLQPDIVLLDIGMPEALKAVGAIVDQFPKTRVVGLAVPEADGDVLACAEAGIAGYVMPEGSVEDLVAAVISAAQGELHCSPRVDATLLQRVAQLALERSASRDLTTLTQRENSIVQLIAEGLSNKEIAARLFIEVATVKSHVHNVLEKLDARTRGEVAARMRTRAARHPAKSHL
jgi:two-component system nitrate/nitrite response regulator NarL